MKCMNIVNKIISDTVRDKCLFLNSSDNTGDDNTNHIALKLIDR